MGVWSFRSSCLEPKYDEVTGVLEAHCWRDGGGYQLCYLDLRMCLWIDNDLTFAPLLEAPHRRFMPVTMETATEKTHYWLDGTKLVVRREFVHVRTRGARSTAGEIELDDWLRNNDGTLEFMSPNIGMPAWMNDFYGWATHTSKEDSLMSKGKNWYLGTDADRLTMPEAEAWAAGMYVQGKALVRPGSRDPPVTDKRIEVEPAAEGYAGKVVVEGALGFFKTAVQNIEHLSGAPSGLLPILSEGFRKPAQTA